MPFFSKLTARHRDEVTGDELSAGEFVSWHVQSVIRRWEFIIAFTAVTAIVWTFGGDSGRNWWNYGASYLAVFIESLVGIAMLGQTHRDAVIIREIRAEILAENRELKQELKQVKTGVEEVETELRPAP